MSGPPRLAGPVVRRHAVLLIWIAGLATAVLAYAVDPGALLAVAAGLLADGLAAVGRLARALSALGNDVVRALAVGLFVTFAALAVFAIRRGAKGGTALLAVSIVFVLLLRDAGGAADGRWAEAAALAAVGALVMTGRARRRGP